MPGISKAYWGPEIRVGAPQPALNAGLDGPHANVTSLSFRFDKEQKELPVVFIQEPVSKAPIPIPIPDITPLNPPLGLVPPLPPKIKFLKDTAKLNPLAASMRGLAYAGQHTDSVFGTGSLDVARYGRVLKSRQLVGVRGAGEAFDGLYYVDVGHHDAQARRVHADLLARPQRAALDPAGGAGMRPPTRRSRADGRQRYYGKYRGTVVNNIDPMQIGRIQAIVPDVSGVIPTSWAMPCLPVAGINTGVFTVPPIGAGVWIEFEQGDPDYPIWVGGYWGTAAERARRWRSTVPPGRQRHHHADDAARTASSISDIPGPTGGILIQTTTGAMISVSDVGIVISNGKGAIINMAGPTVDINVGALTVI